MVPDPVAKITPKKAPIVIVPVQQKYQYGKGQGHRQKGLIEIRIVMIKGEQRSDQGQDDINGQAR